MLVGWQMQALASPSASIRLPTCWHKYAGMSDTCSSVLAHPWHCALTYCVLSTEYQGPLASPGIDQLLQHILPTLSRGTPGTYNLTKQNVKCLTGPAGGAWRSQVSRAHWLSNTMHRYPGTEARNKLTTRRKPDDC